MAEVRKRKWDQESEDPAAAAVKQPKVEGEADAAAAPAAPVNGEVKAEEQQQPAIASTGNAAADAAMAAAARIAAQYGKPSGGSGSPSVARDIPDEGTFTKDIDINDSRNRYLLTRGSTQDEIKAETKALVVTKGTWLPDRSKASDKDPPLYLHISATSQEILDAGVEAVEKLLAQELGPLVTDFRAQRREEQPRERRKWPEERIPVNLETLRNFNVRAKIVGPQGMFVKYIQGETSARVQIKGIGSGFIESETGRESDEPMHIHVSGPEQIMVDRAKDLAEDLLVVVREEWGKAKAVMDGFNNPYAQYSQPPQPSYDASAPPPPGGYPAPPAGDAPPPPPTDGAAPPPPPGGAASGDLVAQAQALAPELDVTLLQFYAGHSTDPATIVYYARMALYYQQQGYTGEGAAGDPAAAAAAQQQQQMASMNAYGTPTQAAYGGGGQQAYAGSPYQPQQPQNAAPPPPPAAGGYDDRSRQAKGQYGNMPPPPGL